MKDRSKYSSVYRSDGSVDAWELGRAFRAAGSKDPEQSSPYMYRGFILDKVKHKSFIQGWTDEDISVISEQEDDAT